MPILSDVSMDARDYQNRTYMPYAQLTEFDGSRTIFSAPGWIMVAAANDTQFCIFRCTAVLGHIKLTYIIYASTAHVGYPKLKVLV